MRKRRDQAPDAPLFLQRSIGMTVVHLPPQPKPPRKWDGWLYVLHGVLPAQSYQEIADRMSAKLHRPFNVLQVRSLLGHLRKWEEYYGWTVPYAQNGINIKGNDRFFAAAAKKDGTTVSEEENEAARDGLISKVGSAMTTAERQAQMLRWIATRTTNARLQRKLNARARETAHSAETLRELLDDLLEEQA
jgi:hypothetical protein